MACISGSELILLACNHKGSACIAVGGVLLAPAGTLHFDLRQAAARKANRLTCDDKGAKFLGSRGLREALCHKLYQLMLS